jgi:5'-nucleotidase
MIILVDMDGVVADFLPTLLEQYNYLTNENVPLDRIKSNKTFKWVGDAILCRKLIETPGFIRGLPPLDGAQEAIERLHGQGHDIVFVSNGTNCPTSGHEKRDWLKFYFSKVWPQKVPLILTSDKWRVRGDVILDDDPKNLIHLDPTTKGLLFSTSYNADVTGFERIYGWDHFIDWVANNDIAK